MLKLLLLKEENGSLLLGLVTSGWVECNTELLSWQTRIVQGTVCPFTMRSVRVIMRSATPLQLVDLGRRRATCRRGNNRFEPSLVHCMGGDQLVSFICHRVTENWNSLSPMLEFLNSRDRCLETMEIVRRAANVWDTVRFIRELADWHPKMGGYPPVLGNLCREFIRLHYPEPIEKMLYKVVYSRFGEIRKTRTCWDLEDATMLLPSYLTPAGRSACDVFFLAICETMAPQSFLNSSRVRDFLNTPRQWSASERPLMLLFGLTILRLDGDTTDYKEKVREYRDAHPFKFQMLRAVANSIDKERIEVSMTQHLDIPTVEKNFLEFFDDYIFPQ
jgi:hypothetical protein